MPTDLFEAAAWQYAIIASCRRCKAEGVFDPHGLWWLFQRKNWDQGLRAVARRLKCRACGCRALVTCVKGRVTTVFLPMPDEREWKRAISRFRS